MRTLVTILLAVLLFTASASGQDAAEQQFERILRELEAIRTELAETRRQNADLQQRLSALSSSMSNLRQQMARINTLGRQAQEQAAPEPIVKPLDAVIDLEGAPVKGSDDARLTLVEFSDFECPYCARYATTTYHQIADAYIDTGKLRYAFLDLPLTSIHRNAFKAAEAGMCAAEQGKFWELHDRLFANQQSLTDFEGHARAVGLDVSAFMSCLESGRHANAVRSDMQTANSLGIGGTPSFALGYTDDGGKTVRLVKTFSGARPFDLFQTEIETMLEESGD